MDEDTGLEENPITTNRFHEISEQGLSLYGGLRFRATSICFSYLLSVAAYVRRADRVSRWKFSNNSTRGFFSFSFGFVFIAVRVYTCSLITLYFLWNVIKKFFPESIFHLLSAPFRFFNTCLCIFRSCIFCLCISRNVIENEKIFPRINL